MSMTDGKKEKEEKRKEIEESVSEGIHSFQKEKR
jgi:hypothetical protein